MSTRDESLAQEAPWAISIASSRGVLSQKREYELIKIAGPSIRAQRILYNPKNEAFLLRHPKYVSFLDRVGKSGLKASRILLEHNYRLIISIAKKHQGRGLSWEDMIQHGSEGFLYAVSRFDMETGNKLSTLATIWIRQRISRAIENTGRLIRIPIHMQAKINEIKYIYRKHMEKHQENPTSEEIAALYNLNSRNKKSFKPITKEEAEELGRHLLEINSLDDSAGDDENLSVLHYIRDESFGTEETVEISNDKSYLANLITLLDMPTAQSFIKFRYGLLDGVHKSDAKTAEAYKMTQREVREEEARILAKLAVFADPRNTNLDLEKEVFSIIVLSGSEEQIEFLFTELGWDIPSLPAKVYESTDKDQMLILQRRLSGWGIRTELISSFQ